MEMVSNHRLVARRLCKATRIDGQPCGMPPMADSDFCWAHDPANAEAAAEARRVGGLRRRKEGTVAGAYSFGGLSNVHDIRRLRHDGRGPASDRVRRAAPVGFGLMASAGARRCAAPIGSATWVPSSALVQPLSRPVLQCLGQVGRLDRVGAGEIRDGP